MDEMLEEPQDMNSEENTIACVIITEAISVNTTKQAYNHIDKCPDTLTD